MERPHTGPTRRTFLRAGLAAGAATSSLGVAGSTLAFLWPDASGSFGGPIALGPPADVQRQVAEADEPLAIPVARAYLVGYDEADDPTGRYAELTAGTGLLALHQRCAHLGCRVPWCVTSAHFECPCHQSRYDRWGEWVDGPADRGLDRFPLTIDDGILIIDTSEVVTGPAQGRGVLGEDAAGPSCLG